MCKQKDSLSVWLVNSCFHLDQNSCGRVTYLNEREISGLSLVMARSFNKKVQLTHIASKEGLLRWLNNGLCPNLIILEICFSNNHNDYIEKKFDMNGGYFIWWQLRIKKEWGEDLAAVPILVITQRSQPWFQPEMMSDQNLRWLSWFEPFEEKVRAIEELLPLELAAKKDDNVSSQWSKAGDYFTVSVPPSSDLAEVMEQFRSLSEKRPKQG